MIGRLIAALLLVLAGSWVAPAAAYACEYDEATDAENLQRADVVFTGTIAREEDEKAAQLRTFTFAVDRVYKGTATATQVVTTPSLGGMCGLEISGTGTFLVFAQQEGSGLTAGLGGGTRVRPAPASLGAGQPPQADPAAATPGQRPDAAPPATQGTWIPLVGFVLAATAAAVVGRALIRRRPRS